MRRRYHSQAVCLWVRTWVQSELSESTFKSLCYGHFSHILALFRHSPQGFNDRQTREKMPNTLWFPLINLAVPE